MSVNEENTPSHEIALTIGIFFDGTGNNASNTHNVLEAFTAEHYSLNTPEAEKNLVRCAQQHYGLSGTESTSYGNYYTNIHWLNELYVCGPYTDGACVQWPVYIEGTGTTTDKPDSMLGMGLGIFETGVTGKADKAVSLISVNIQDALTGVRRTHPGCPITITSLQFDIFGFSRGGAAARHLANRIQSNDRAIINAIRIGTEDVSYQGLPAGKTRFLGLFDTVAAIGTLGNGINPHSSNTGDVRLALRPGAADKVFHITAAHECRFNFALNSVRPAWPELALPGVHSDIGGGYLPVTQEALFLTRPEAETVPLGQDDRKSMVYSKAAAVLLTLASSPCLRPLLRINNITAETWHDDRMPVDFFGQRQKRSYAALTLRNRIVHNDWSKVALRIMMEAAQDAGVLFEPIGPSDPRIAVADELVPLCKKAMAMGRAVRSGQKPQTFDEEEMDILAKKYMHCSARWNVIREGHLEGCATHEILTDLTNRPDLCWKRTVYNMDGQKITG